MKLRANLGIRMLFGGTLVLFALQPVFSALGGKWGEEPYPGLIMPAFAGHPLQGGVIVLNEPAVEVRFVDGNTRSVPFESILPKSSVVPSKIFSTAFADDGFLSDPDTVVWLKSRISRKFPLETPSGVDIIWRTATYSIDNKTATQYSPLRAIHVEFEGKK